MRENQKSAEIKFPSRGKTRNQRKSAFPHEGKSKNGENQLSLTGENKITARTDFPPQEKAKKC